MFSGLKVPIIDLHCDLLWYLSLDGKRTATDLDVRCSLPQLKKGNVKIQTLPVFVETGEDSLENGNKQFEIFKTLPKQYPNDFQFIRQAKELVDLSLLNKIGILPAIENASAFCNEKEELLAALERLTAMQKKIGKFVYVSLTWNSENRFGGGALTKIGLKEDGKLLVDYLCEKGIPLDFSHASDYLAYDLLNYIEKKGLKLPVLASHSNMRAISDFPRNLPDEVAREIIKREGLIGINFIRYFLGKESPHSFSKQLEHLLEIGGENQACFGADFFCIEDLPSEMQKPAEVLFFPSYDHAGTYEKVIALWKKELFLSDEVIERICYGNFIRFFKILLF